MNVVNKKHQFKNLFMLFFLAAFIFLPANGAESRQLNLLGQDEGGYCGDKIVQPELGEECEGRQVQACADNGYQGKQICQPSICEFKECRLTEFCGDGAVNGPEECDDGSTVSGDGCSSLCVIEVLGAVCGNGLIEEGEQCDDDNEIAGDGCDQSCQIEPGNTCIGEPSVCEESSGDITVSLIPSRTSGVAPLAVFFDASQTTSTSTNRPFHELGYSWNFGDPSSGAWNTNGLSKNTATGPVSAHVFEPVFNPGETEKVFSVTLLVTDTTGAQASILKTITVQNPDSVFAGTKTTCVSSGTIFTGCPSGAQHVTTSSFSTAMSHAGTGKRLLFRRGDIWSVTSKAVLNYAGPSVIGAFGTGSRPQFNATNSSIFQLSDHTPKFDDARIMDLDMYSLTKDNVAIYPEGTASGVSLIRLGIHEFGGGMVWSTSTLSYWNGQSCCTGMHTLWDQIAMVELTIDQVKDDYMVYFGGTRLMMMGNEFHDSTEATTVVRITYADKAVISDNNMSEAADKTHIVKLHAPTYNGGGFFGQEHPYTQKIAMNRNNFTAGNVEDWAVVLGPQEHTYDERLRDIILDGNEFYAGNSTDILLRQSGEDITIRNNIFNGNNSVGLTNIYITPRGVEPAPKRVHVYNNMIHTSENNTWGMSGVKFSATTTNSVAKNNLIYAPANGGGKGVINEGSGNNITISNNLGYFPSNPGTCVNPAGQSLCVDPKFANYNIGDFHLMPNSPAVDSGDNVFVFGDVEGNIRPLDGNSDGAAKHDIGAFEYAP